MVSIRDSEIILKYSDKAEYIQAYFDLPANTSITLTYTPPSGFYLITLSTVTGPVSYYVNKVDVMIDGTYVHKGLRATGALENVIDNSYYRPTKNEMIINLTNEDTMSHTVDYIFIGVLMPKGQWDMFVKEIRGDDIKEKMDKTNELLTSIRDWFMKPLKK